MALESTPPLSIKNQSGYNRNIAQEVDGDNIGDKSLWELGITAGKTSGGVSMLEFLGYSKVTTPIYIGFNNDGSLNLSTLSTNVISIQLKMTVSASQSWINCDFPPIGQASGTYYINNVIVLNLYVEESSATESNRDPYTDDVQTTTISNCNSSTTSSIIYSTNNISDGCGDGWGTVFMQIMSITKESGPDNITISPTANTWQTYN